MSSESPHVVWLEDCGPSDVARVGAKNARLGEMIHVGMPVPPGFAIATSAFKMLLARYGLDSAVRVRLSQADVRDLHALAEISSELRGCIESMPLAAELEEVIGGAYLALCGRQGLTDMPVAVRSSAIAEDLPGASFAGQHDTFLWIRGVGPLLRHVRKCWSSLFNARAIAYRAERGVPIEQVDMSVAIQKMVDARAAGVACTLNPINGDASKIAIDACWGLGQAVANGEVTPDNYLVDKVVVEIARRTISTKQVEYALDAEAAEVARRQVPADRQAIPCLDDEEVVGIARLARRIEVHYGEPQDIEWAIDAHLPPTSNILVLQTRPETAWSRRARRPLGEGRSSRVEGVLATLLRPLKPGDPKGERP